MKTIQWLSALMALFSFVNFVEAELMLRPPGLEDGDQYRLVFITAGSTSALSGDIEFYNDFVQAAADAAPVVGSWGLDWKAMISTEDVNVRVNTETTDDDVDVPIYRVDGLQVVFDYGHLYGFGEFSGRPFLNPISLTVLETLASLPNVWTGTTSFGQTGRAPPNNLVDGGIPGSPSQIDAWRTAGVLDARGQAHLYAISNVITVPEPKCAVIPFWSFASFCFTALRTSKVR